MPQRFYPGMGEAPISEPPPGRIFHEESAIYLAVDRTLTANQELPDLSMIVDADSDFIWEAIAGSKTAEYEIRFRLPNGRQMSSSRVRAANVVGSAQFPVYLPVPVIISAAGRIGIDVKDLSGSSNTIQVALWGRRRFAT